jgi:hypothetical protein
MIGEQIYIDISSVKNSSFGGAKYWILMEDEKSHFCWSLFATNKSDLSSKVIPVLKRIKKEIQIEIKIIRCDNAAENKKLQENVMNDESLNYIKFEFTAPYTPQQNGVVERKFATLYGRVRAMLNGARLPERLRAGLWAHAAETATSLSNIEIKPGGQMSSYESVYGKLPGWASHLKIFGEVAIVANDKNRGIQGKLED